MNFDPRRSIFIHGLEGTSRGVKATLLRRLFPEMLIPDFSGGLDERMRLMTKLLGEERGWTMIGSSLGGLMAAWFTCLHPAQVRKLILLAPALIWPGFAEDLPVPVDTPTIVYHGTRDGIIPLPQVRSIAERVFSRLILIEVDDDHGLYQTANTLDWRALLA